MQDLLEKLHYPVLLLAPTTEVRWANSAFERLVGHPLGRHAGQRLGDIPGLLAPAYATASQTALELLTDQSAPLPELALALGLSETQRASGCRHSDHILVQLHPQADPTAAQQLEEARQEVRRLRHEAQDALPLMTLGHLANAIIHEMRGPLTVYAGLAAKLLRVAQSGDEAELRRAAVHAGERIDHLGGVVRDIASAVRAVVAQEPHSPAGVTPLHQTITDAILLTEAYTKGSGIRIDAPPYIDETLYFHGRHADAVAIIANLVHNAADALVAESVPPEKRWIRLKVTAEHHYIDVFVEDGGPGIPDALAGQVFERGTTTKGSGVGLFLSRALAEACGGSLRLLAPKAPTTMRLRLRRAADGTTAEHPNEKP